MDNLFILLLMVFLHIVDDYYLQGWLASAKQKVWWEKNAPDNLYAHDYLMALGMHAFSWTFMIMLPIVIYFGITINFLILFVLNFCVHFITDNAKANQHKINLIQDQCIHLFQIFMTYLSFISF